MFGLPILLTMQGVILDPNGQFEFMFLGSISADIGALFFSLNIYKNYLIKHGFSLKFINQINHRLFGDKDIGSNSLFFGFLLLFLISLYSPSISFFISTLSLKMLYLFLIVIFISMIWSNQIKAFFYHLKPF